MIISPRFTQSSRDGRQVTLGLATPRRRKRMPVVPSQKEVMRLLAAAPSLRDKLLIGLMYATGVRVSEVVRLRWRDCDFDRRVVSIWQGKGRVDRQVMLPTSFESLLKQLSQDHEPDEFLFPSESQAELRRRLDTRAKANRRYLSPRTVERVVERAVKIARIGKHLTPHSMRHGFAAHLLENGTDIRFIQKLLGHARLETTTIYTRVAVIRRDHVASPLDRIVNPKPAARPTTDVQRPVGKLQIDMRLRSAPDDTVPIADVVLTVMNQSKPVELSGIVLREARPGWISMDLPALETWSPALRQLLPAQRQRIESAEFYQHLQTHLTAHFLANRRE